MLPDAILETQGLSVTINHKQVCSDLNMRIVPGQRWGLLGINGVGKTTLLHTLAGLRTPNSGSVALFGDDLHHTPRRKIAQTIGVLLQDSYDAFPSTVLETALIGRHPFLHSWQWETPADIALTKRALSQVGLGDMESRLTNTLSGGERRRLALAALFTQDPILYLLDEPTNHLDLHHQMGILKMFHNRITKTDRALLMILHDINLASRFCDQILLLFGQGEVLLGPSTEILNIANLTRLFGHPIMTVNTDIGSWFVPE